MKTYIRFLDTLILSFLILAIHFNLHDNVIINQPPNRRGAVTMMIISWQTLLGLASFCVFLRYVVRRVRVA
jgi:hypothetical protein